MTNNVMETYMKISKNFLKKFTKAFFAEKYDEKVSNEYIEAYMDARVYSYGDENQKFFYKKISSRVEEKSEEIKKENKKADVGLLEDMVKMYEFIYYIDGVRGISDLKEFVKQMYQRRNKSFDLVPIKGLENRLYKMIKEYLNDQEEFFKSFETNDFSLEIDKYILVDNTYKVKLNYNFKVPYIYSNKVIEEVFNEGTINEDKLIVEYTLLAALCVKDINNAIFSKVYIVEFAKSILNKSKKLKQTLRVLDDPAIQDKIIMKLQYSDFILNKELIYSLMKDGFKFAIVIDDNFTATLTNLKKLDMFEYLIVSKENKNYEPIQDNETKIKNEIIYE